MDLGQPQLIDYIELIYLLNKDRQQTMRSSDTGFYEKNPLLDRHPSQNKINAYFGLLATAPLFMPNNLPDWLKTSILASANYTEKFVIDNNKRSLLGQPNNNGLPFGIIFKTYSDWDRPLEKLWNKKP